MTTSQIDGAQCEGVELVPGCASGAPVLRDTRLRIDAILANLNDGLEPEELAAAFEVNPEHVVSAVDAARAGSFELAIFGQLPRRRGPYFPPASET